MMMMLLDFSMSSFCARLNDKLHQILTFIFLISIFFLMFHSILNPIHRNLD